MYSRREVTSLLPWRAVNKSEETDHLTALATGNSWIGWLETRFDESSFPRPTFGKETFPTNVSGLSWFDSNLPPRPALFPVPCSLFPLNDILSNIFILPIVLVRRSLN
ncbi:MAG: hypothetical protein ACRC2V_06850 [Xenococcaceae cyanobacterium]